MTRRLLAVAVWVSLLGACRSEVRSDFAVMKKTLGKYEAQAVWREGSILNADFTCSGKQETALLGATVSDILIAVFVQGLAKKPEILSYSKSARNASTITLAIEDLDIDPQKDLGYELPGYQSSKTCKGLNLSDGEVDSAHIYWNRAEKRFVDWSL